MAGSVHKIMVTGRLTANPDLRFTPNGTPVTKLRVAVDDVFRRDDEWVNETTFYTVELWGKAAEFFETRLTKGDLVYVEGQPRLNVYKRREPDRDGLNAGHELVIRFPRVTVLQRKKAQGDYQAAPEVDDEPVAEEVAEETEEELF